jgi:hypothetical protein
LKPCPGRRADNQANPQRRREGQSSQPATPDLQSHEPAIAFDADDSSAHLRRGDGAIALKRCIPAQGEFFFSVGASADGENAMSHVASPCVTEHDVTDVYLRGACRRNNQVFAVTQRGQHAATARTKTNAQSLLEKAVNDLAE